MSHLGHVGRRPTPYRRRAIRGVRRLVRVGLRRYARAAPRDGGDRDRIVILLGSAWGLGGTIRTTLNLAGHLAGRHEVEILSVVRRRHAPFFAFPPGVRVTALDDQRRRGTPLALRPLRALLARRRSALMPRSTRPFAECSLWTDVQLARRLRGGRGVVIGTHVSLNLLLADLDLPGYRTIGVEHMHLRAHRGRVRRRIERLYPRLDALVVLTERDAAAFAEVIGPARRPVVIPNTVRALEGHGARGDAPVILAAGRLTPQKGFDLLIHAFARVAPAHPEWRLRIHGEGHQRRELERLVRALGLRASVALPGAARRLGEELDGASVFALPSRFEGMPLVLLEAMSKRLAIVSFDCPTGPGDVLEDGVTGLLVPARDIDGFARALLDVVADADLRRRLGDRAAVAAEAYSIEAVGPRWDALLAALHEPKS